MNWAEFSGYVGVDIGGQSIRVGTPSPDGRLRILRQPPAEDFRKAVQQIAEMAKELCPEGIRRIGIGTPGPLDWRKGRLIGKTPNLPWADVSFLEIGEVLNCPTIVDNDANVAGLAEAVMGAGRGYSYVCGFTLGTGIGCFSVYNGRIFHGALDVEGGHQIILPDGPLCNCGQRGCLEALASATAIERRWGVPPAQLEDAEVWKEIARYLAQGLVNLTVLCGAEVLVLAGGMIERGPMLFAPLEEYYRSMIKVIPAVPIKKAELGTDAGVIGALVLAKVGHSEE